MKKKNLFIGLAIVVLTAAANLFFMNTSVDKNNVELKSLTASAYASSEDEATSNCETAICWIETIRYGSVVRTNYYFRCESGTARSCLVGVAVVDSWYIDGELVGTENMDLREKKWCDL